MLLCLVCLFDLACFFLSSLIKNMYIGECSLGLVQLDISLYVHVHVMCEPSQVNNVMSLCTRFLLELLNREIKLENSSTCFNER